MEQNYTIKQLADICDCSKVTIQKHLQKLKRKPLMQAIGNKSMHIFALTQYELNSIKSEVEANKKALNPSKNNPIIVNAIDNTSQGGVNQENKTVSNLDYMVQYYETLTKYNNLVESNKLLTDKSREREGLYINEINDLRKDKETLIAKKSELEALQNSLQDSNNKLEGQIESISKDLNIKTRNLTFAIFACGILATVSIMLILYLVVNVR